MIITLVLAALLGLIFGMGFFFDKAHPYSNKYASEKQRQTFQLLAHIMGELAMLTAFVTIVVLNTTLWWLSGLGAILWVLSTILMGISQSKGRDDRNWLYFGNGKGSTPELICSAISKITGVKYVTASVILRVVIVGIGIATSIYLI